MSANRSDFNFAMADSLADDVRGIANLPQAGFNMHLMASYTLSRHMRLRFEPGLSFQDRALNYRFAGQADVVRRTEAVNLDIPLLLKYRTDRLDNFAAYALFGVKYMRDFQSQENVNQQLQSDNILRLQSGNFAADLERASTCSCPFSSSPSKPRRNKASSTSSSTTATTPTLWNSCVRELCVVLLF